MRCVFEKNLGAPHRAYHRILYSIQPIYTNTYVNAHMFPFQKQIIQLHTFCIWGDDLSLIYYFGMNKLFKFNTYNYRNLSLFILSLLCEILAWKILHNLRSNRCFEVF